MATRSSAQRFSGTCWELRPAALELTSLIDWFRRFCGFPDTAGASLRAAPWHLPLSHAASRRTGRHIQLATIYFPIRPLKKLDERRSRRDRFAPGMPKSPSTDRISSRSNLTRRDSRGPEPRVASLLRRGECRNDQRAPSILFPISLTLRREDALAPPMRHGAAAVLCDRGRKTDSSIASIHFRSIRTNALPPFECGASSCATPRI